MRKGMAQGRPNRLRSVEQPTFERRKIQIQQAAARSLGLEAHVLHATDDPELEAAFAVLDQLRVGALAIGPDPFFTSRSKMLGKLTLQHAIPTIYQYRDFTAAGGLKLRNRRLGSIL